jgi:hypothetical protein
MDNYEGTYCIDEAEYCINELFLISIVPAAIQFYNK